MKLELITDFENLKLRRRAWDRVAGAFPFHRWAWLGNWFQHLGSEFEPLVLVAHGEPNTPLPENVPVERREHWAGIAPLCIEKTSLGKKVRFWGSGHACTDYMGLITRESDHQAFTFAVADWLRDQTQPGGRLESIDMVELEGHSDHPDNRVLLEAMESNGFRPHQIELEGCWVVDLPADWPTLNQRFSKSMRRKTKKAVQRLADENTSIRDSRDLGIETLWPAFVELHQRRRESLGQPGCFSDSRFETFLYSAILELNEEHRADLKVIDFEGQPLAAMLLVNDVRTRYMYQSGVDTSRMQLEPGYQSVLSSIEASIEDGFEHFDFLRGDEPYKSRWNTTRVPILRTRWVPRKLKSLVKHNLWVAGRTVKGYLRKPAN